MSKTEIEHVNVKKEFCLYPEVEVHYAECQSHERITFDIKKERPDNVASICIKEGKEIHEANKKEIKTYGNDVFTTNESSGTSETSGQYPCHICGATFDHISKVAHHLNEHAARSYPCPHCSCIFNFESDLKTHQLIHNTDPAASEQIFICDVCGEKYPRQELLDAHKTNHKEKHNSRGFPCPHCSAMLKTQYILKTHIANVHYTDQPFTCDDCGKKLPSLWSYKQHVKIHEGKCYTCKFCGKQCSAPSKLKSHLISHSGVKDYECKICNKRFQREQSLKIHTKIHMGQKNFLCELCEKSFGSVAELKIHKKFHDKIKLHKCLDCDSRFTVSSQLRSHFLAMHSTETPFSCQACNLKFKSKKTWKYHTLAQHSTDKAYKCKLCDKGFQMKYLLVQHELVHSDQQPYSCEHCEVRFKARKYLHVHMRAKHKGESSTK